VSKDHADYEDKMINRKHILIQPLALSLVEGSVEWIENRKLKWLSYDKAFSLLPF